MTMDGGKVVKSAPARAHIYSLVALVITALTVFGVVEADELDGDVIADAIVQLVAAVSLLLARLNVQLRGAYDG